LCQNETRGKKRSALLGQMGGGNSDKIYFSLWTFSAEPSVSRTFSIP
jgi:hypothetical protein